jgi:hypothetical protein
MFFPTFFDSSRKRDFSHPFKLGAFKRNFLKEILGEKNIERLLF